MSLHNFYLITVFSLSLVLGQKVCAQKQNNFMSEYYTQLWQSEKNANPSKPAESPNLFENTPLGEAKGAIPPECNPQEFQRRVLALYQNPNQYAQMTQSYFHQCSSYLQEGNSKGLMAILKFSNTNYDPEKNPLIKKIFLTLSDGTKIVAYVGVKDMETPRPWVVAKCGVFCDITDTSSVSNFIINYFDQSPFNVIFLSNHTGHEHIKMNGTLTLGGFYEVFDLYDVAYWLKYKSPYQQTVDSIHAAGISLGGSTAMAVSHLNRLFHSPDGSSLFNSTTAICPVVNLGPTLKDMYADTNKGRIFKRMTWKYLKEAEPYLSDVNDYLGAKNPPNSEGFPLMLGDIVFRYGVRWENTKPPGRSAPIPDSIAELMNYNHFADDDETLPIPTLAWASKDDRVVSFKLNTETLINAAQQVPEQGAVGVEYGDHCGFATVYGYNPTTAVLQSFVLNNSPNFKARRQWRVMPLSPNLPKFMFNEVHLRQWWVAKENTTTVTLNYETFSSNLGLQCRFAEPFDSPSECRTLHHQQVPLDSLKALALTMPTNPTEAQILSRKLNGLLRVSREGSPIDGTFFKPNQLTWYDY